MNTHTKSTFYIPVSYDLWVKVKCSTRSGMSSMNENEIRNPQIIAIDSGMITVDSQIQNKSIIMVKELLL
jgi:hypothetical protein